MIWGWVFLAAIVLALAYVTYFEEPFFLSGDEGDDGFPSSDELETMVDEVHQSGIVDDIVAALRVYTRDRLTLAWDAGPSNEELAFVFARLYGEACAVLVLDGDGAKVERINEEIDRAAERFISDVTAAWDQSYDCPPAQGWPSPPSLNGFDLV